MRWTGRRDNDHPLTSASSSDKEDGCCLWPQILMLRRKKVDKLEIGAFHKLLQHGAKRHGHKEKAAWDTSWGSVGNLSPPPRGLMISKRAGRNGAHRQHPWKVTTSSQKMTESLLGKVTQGDAAWFFWSYSSCINTTTEGTGEEEGWESTLSPPTLTPGSWIEEAQGRKQSLLMMKLGLRLKEPKGCHFSDWSDCRLKYWGSRGKRGTSKPISSSYTPNQWRLLTK